MLQNEAAAAQQDGEQLVWEVWDVVDREFLDARQTGFDRGQWAAARDAALAGGHSGRRASLCAVWTPGLAASDVAAADDPLQY